MQPSCDHGQCRPSVAGTERRSGTELSDVPGTETCFGHVRTQPSAIERTIGVDHADEGRVVGHRGLLQIRKSGEAARLEEWCSLFFAWGEVQAVRRALRTGELKRRRRCLHVTQVHPCF